jgi:hypothetical protein
MTTQELELYDEGEIEDGQLQIVDAPDTGSVPTIYHSAGTLALTKEEQAALTAPFDEDQIEIRPEKEGLIYIPHQPLRVRLNNVVGPGQWSMVPMGDPVLKDGKVYQQWALFVRGRFVSQAWGSARYSENNARADYSDSLETVKSEVLRRLCKDAGIGLEAWNKRFALSWRDRYAVKVFVKEDGKTTVRWRRKDDPPFTDYKDDPIETGAVPIKTATESGTNQPKSGMASRSSDAGNGGGRSGSVSDATDQSAGSPAPVAPKGGVVPADVRDLRDGESLNVFDVILVGKEKQGKKGPYWGIKLRNSEGTDFGVNVFSSTQKGVIEQNERVAIIYTKNKGAGGKVFFNPQEVYPAGAA